MAKVSISDTFDGGNIAFVEQSTEADDNVSVKLQIKPDVFTELEQTEHFQYFCFRAMQQPASSVPSTAASTVVKYQIINAGKASYPDAWEGYTVFASNQLHDCNSWRRVLDTAYDDNTGTLSWSYEHTHDKDAAGVYFAYFPPYSTNRHLDLIAKCAQYSQRAKATVMSLGQSLDGREVECVKVGSGPRVAWIIHRQHPGETMAEYYAEGLLSRLLGLDTNGEVDGMVTELKEMYTFYIVPCMCPDGAARGHLRTNAAGANLNREWTTTTSKSYPAPTLKNSPEVHHVLTKMNETGVDFFLDIHGDEKLPYNFLSGAEGTTHWGARLEHLHGAFLAAYHRVNSDMNVKIGYDPSPPGGATMSTATSGVANLFDCFSATLEMPFKDCASNKDEERGWSPQRARMLGASVLEAMKYIHPFLREEGEFWKGFGEEEMYVAPTSDYENQG